MAACVLHSMPVALKSVTLVCEHRRQVRMADTLGMAAQLAGQSLRFGWYFALNRALDWRTDQLGKTPRYKPARPVPTLQQLLADRAQLLMADAMAVRDGLYPPMDDDGASPLR